MWNRVPRGVRSALSLVTFLAVLDVFFVSIGLLSAFKAAGKGYGHELILEMATNPLIGLMVGILVTSIIQSSSSTTTLVVGLVAGGALGDNVDSAVRIAIPIIMGANIGTSVTNILVSFGHIGDRREFERAFSSATVHDFFNLLSVIVLLPLQATTNFLGKLSLASVELFTEAGGLSFSSPFKLFVKPQQHAIKGLVAHESVATFIVAAVLIAGASHLLIVLGRRSASGQQTGWLRLLLVFGGAGLAAVFSVYPVLLHSSELATFVLALAGLFGSLYGMVRIMRTAVLSRVERLFHDYIFRTALRAFVLGLLLTALVQSSSVTTSLIVPLAGAGLLTIHQVFPYTLGANVGTTVTAMLAALSLGEPAAIAVATAHLLFNICGIAIFYPLRAIPKFLSTRLARLAAAWPPAAVIFVIVVFFLTPMALIAITR